MSTTLTCQRVQRDLVEVLSNPLSGLFLYLKKDGGLMQWTFSIKVFVECEFISDVYFSIEFPSNYPLSAPAIYCLTHEFIPRHSSIVHGINGKKSVCMSILDNGQSTFRYDGWSSAYSALSILMQMQDFFNGTLIKSSEVPNLKAKVRIFEETILKNEYDGMEFRESFYEIKSPPVVVSNPSVAASLVSPDNIILFDSQDDHSDSFADFTLVKKKSAAPLKDSSNNKRISLESAKDSCKIDSHRINQLSSNTFGILDQENIIPSSANVERKAKVVIKKLSTGNNTSVQIKTISNHHDAVSHIPGIWKTKLHSILPPNFLLGEKISYEDTYNEFSGKFTNPIQRLHFTVQDSDMNISSRNNCNASYFNRLSTTLIQSILLLCSDTDIMNMIATCQFMNLVCCESSSLWQQLVHRRFPLCKVVPVGINGTGLVWKRIFLMEVNNVKYNEIQCFLTKATLDQDIIGIPLEYTVNPKTRNIDYIYSTMDYLSKTGYYEHNNRKTMWRESFKAWIPLYLTEDHFNRSLPYLEKAFLQLVPLVTSQPRQYQQSSSRFIAPPSKGQYQLGSMNISSVNNSTKAFSPNVILSIIPRLMNTMILLLIDKGVDQFQIDQSLRGYCLLHRLFIALVEKFPALKTEVHRRLRQFIDNTASRHKQSCPNLGELIPLLSVCENIGWLDIIVPLIEESVVRSILWVAKDIPEFAELVQTRAKTSTSAAISPELLDQILSATSTSRKLYSFHCCFLRIFAQSRGTNIKKLSQSYDMCYGLPTSHQLKSFSMYLKKVSEIKTWDDYYDTICLKHTSPDILSRRILKCIDMSLVRGYHTPTTDFSSIQKSGVSNILLRGMSYPRIVICIDHSGSMASKFTHPTTKEQISRLSFVKEILVDVLNNRLTSNQQFSIIFFDHGLDYLWSDKQLKQVTPANIKTAIAYCSHITPDGGTDFDIALTASFSVPNVEAIYFLSDGEAGGGIAHYTQLIRGFCVNRKICCHTTALFAPKSGQDLLQAIATTTGGTFLNYVADDKASNDYY